MHIVARGVAGITTLAVATKDISGTIDSDGVSLGGTGKVDGSECAATEQEAVVLIVGGFPVVANDLTGSVNSQRPGEYRAGKNKLSECALVPRVSVVPLIAITWRGTEVSDDRTGVIDTRRDGPSRAGIVDGGIGLGGSGRDQC